MRKRGAKVTKVIKSKILTKAEVQRQTLPLHVALTLLPLGLFTRDHANKVAFICNVVMEDARGRNEVSHQAAQLAGETLYSMLRRVEQGKSWNVTQVERDTLMSSIVMMDTHIRLMTRHRWLQAALVVREVNAMAREAGYTFLDQVTVMEEE